MSIDCPQIECRFHNDPRLMVGIATIVAHAAAHAGLGEREQESLSEATVKACQEGFCRGLKNLREDCSLRLGIASFPDRVEVNIDFPEEQPRQDHIDAKEPCEQCRVKLVQRREVAKAHPRQ